jgi:hypothetical protein
MSALKEDVRKYLKESSAFRKLILSMPDEVTRIEFASKVDMLVLLLRQELRFTS